MPQTRNPLLPLAAGRAGARRLPPDDPKEIAARRDLEFCKLADHVATVIAGFPPPTEEQLDRVAALLRVGSRRGTP